MLLEGETHFGILVMGPLKIVGWLSHNWHAQIQLMARDHISLVLVDAKKITVSKLKGTMNTPLYNLFFKKFVEYACLKMKDLNVWSWRL